MSFIHRLSWIGVFLATLAGCASDDSDELLSERFRLEQDRHSLMNQVNRHAPGLRAPGPRWEDEALQNVGRINDRIGDVDRQLYR